MPTAKLHFALGFQNNYYVPILVTKDQSTMMPPEHTVHLNKKNETKSTAPICSTIFHVHGKAHFSSLFQYIDICCI